MKLQDFKLFKGKQYKFSAFSINGAFMPYRVMAYGSDNTVLTLYMRFRTETAEVVLHSMVQKNGRTSNMQPKKIPLKFE